MNTHIDQLAQWYADAERITVTNLPRIGDTLIFPHNAGGYAIEVEEDDWTPNIVMPGEVARILHRAPKPKPAWHGAPAVTATYRDDCGMVTGVWTPSGNHGYWIGPEDDVVMHDSLEDVTPLIEAKVTDEMVERARNAPSFDGRLSPTPRLVREMLTAALGLETA